MNERQPPRFVCTWCGAGFDRRYRLLMHWSATPECSANRTVNNPTQTKYEVRDDAVGLRFVDEPEGPA